MEQLFKGAGVRVDPEGQGLNEKKGNSDSIQYMYAESHVEGVCNINGSA